VLSASSIGFRLCQQHEEDDIESRGANRPSEQQLISLALVVVVVTGQVRLGQFLPCLVGELVDCDLSIPTARLAVAASCMETKQHTQLYTWHRQPYLYT